jgi:hypothetical protein
MIICTRNLLKVVVRLAKRLFFYISDFLYLLLVFRTGVWNIHIYSSC